LITDRAVKAQRWWILTLLLTPESGDIKVDGVSISMGKLRSRSNSRLCSQTIHLTEDPPSVNNAAFGVADHF
jgi:hypothetical protein